MGVESPTAESKVDRSTPESHATRADWVDAPVLDVSVVVPVQSPDAEVSQVV